MNMNMNMNLKLNVNPIAILSKLSRLRWLVITLIVVGTVGYTAFQIFYAVTVYPDPTTIEQKIEEANSQTVKLDKGALEAVKKLSRVPVQADTSNPGKADPFSP